MHRCTLGYNDFNNLHNKILRHVYKTRVTFFRAVSCAFHSMFEKSTNMTFKKCMANGPVQYLCHDVYFMYVIKILNFLINSGTTKVKMGSTESQPPGPEAPQSKVEYRTNIVLKNHVYSFH
jgi:hypothetical protein